LSVLSAVTAALLLGAVLREVEPGEDPFRAAGFETALPLLAVGLAGSLAWLRDLASRKPGRVLVAAGALLVGWNVLSMEQYRRRHRVLRAPDGDERAAPVGDDRDAARMAGEYVVRGPARRAARQVRRRGRQIAPGRQRGERRHDRFRRRAHRSRARPRGLVGT